MSLCCSPLLTCILIRVFSLLTFVHFFSSMYCCISSLYCHSFSSFTRNFNASFMQHYYLPSLLTCFVLILYFFTLTLYLRSLFCCSVLPLISVPFIAIYNATVTPFTSWCGLVLYFSAIIHCFHSRLCCSFSPSYSFALSFVITALTSFDVTVHLFYCLVFFFVFFISWLFCTVSIRSFVVVLLSVLFLCSFLYNRSTDFIRPYCSPL